MNLPSAFNLIAVAAFVASPLPARAEVIEIDWGTQQAFERRVQIAPGKFAEVCGKLAKGTTVTWGFDASAPLDFNVHYHMGKEVVFPAKLAGVAKANDTLDAKVEQDYCWMWSNKSAAQATLIVKLRR